MPCRWQKGAQQLNRGPEATLGQGGSVCLRTQARSSPLTDLPAQHDPWESGSQVASRTLLQITRELYLKSIPSLNNPYNALDFYFTEDDENGYLDRS